MGWISYFWRVNRCTTFFQNADPQPPLPLFPVPPVKCRYISESFGFHVQKSAESISEQARQLTNRSRLDINEASRTSSLLEQHHHVKLKIIDVPLSTAKLLRHVAFFCYWAVREMGISMAEMARRLGISSPAVSQSVQRGEKIASENGYRLIKSET